MSDETNILNELIKLNFFIKKLSFWHFNPNNSRYLAKNYQIRDKIISRTSYLPIDCLLKERLYHILHNLYEIPKCSYCEKPIKFNNKYLNTCSVKCNINYEKNTIDPLSGKTLMQIKVDNNIKSNNKVNPLTGLTSYQTGAKKSMIARRKIDPISGKSKQQILTEKTVLTKYKIDPISGKTIHKLSMDKASLTMKTKININTGKTIYQEATTKRVNNLKTSINGITRYEEIGLKVRQFNFKSLFNSRVKAMSDKTIPLFDYSLELTNDNLSSLPFLCINCNKTFFDRFRGGVYYTRCIDCFPINISTQRCEVAEFIKSLGFEIIENIRSIIKPLELDIFIPSKNIAIEFNGLYWHSYEYQETKIEINYHLNKTNRCLDENIQLIHIFENEWSDKQDIVKSRIKSLLQINKTIFARKCIIKEIDNKTSSIFLDKNHLQGSCQSLIKLGLYYNDILVSVMTFGKSRYNKKYEYELIRFSNILNNNVIGAAGKLLKYFEISYNPKSIISYADRRYSNGNLYKKLNFEESLSSKPNYFYFKNDGLESRIKYQKHKLQNIFDNFNIEKSEAQNMFDNGYRRIWDCGNMVFIKNYN